MFSNPPPNPLLGTFLNLPDTRLPSGTPKISLLFILPLKIPLFVLSLGVFWLNLGGVFENKTMQIWALWAIGRHPSGPTRLGTREPWEFLACILENPTLQIPPNSTHRRPEGGRKNDIFGKKKRKREILGPHPSGPVPFGPQLFGFTHPLPLRVSCVAAFDNYFHPVRAFFLFRCRAAFVVCAFFCWFCYFVSFCLLLLLLRLLLLWVIPSRHPLCLKMFVLLFMFFLVRRMMKCHKIAGSIKRKN